MPVHPPGTKAFVANERSLVLRDGRIIVPVYAGIGATPTSANPKLIRRFSHDFANAVRYTLSYSYTYYSDDEGEPWTAAEPTEVAICPGPCSLERLPKPAICS